VFYTLSVGKPVTPYLVPISLLSSKVVSIAASAMLCSFSAVAASLNSGASFLQWPHQGA